VFFFRRCTLCFECSTSPFPFLFSTEIFLFLFVALRFMCSDVFPRLMDKTRHFLFFSKWLGLVPLSPFLQKLFLLLTDTFLPSLAEEIFFLKPLSPLSFLFFLGLIQHAPFFHFRPPLEIFGLFFFFKRTGQSPFSFS